MSAPAACDTVPGAPVAQSEEQRTFNPRARRSKLRGGTTSPAIGDLPANMQAKIQIELCPVAGLPGFCWAWTGARMPAGYGQVGVDGKTQLAHRVTYQLLIGPIPDELQLDHLCLNKPCCHPLHTEPVTAVVNGRRARADRFRCAQGHPLAGRNLVIRIRRGCEEHRTCRLCQYEWQRQSRHNTGISKRTRSVARKRAEILADGERALAEQLVAA